MKISKTLLQGILVGVAMGTAVSSCSLTESAEDGIQLKKGIVECEIGNNGHTDNCPSCGMG